MANFPASVSTNANLYIAVNGIQTTLAANILSTDTTILLTSTSSFPTTGLVTIENNEVVSYTGISGANLTGCVRGADGTTALAHSNGVTVGLTVVAAHHNLLKDEVIAIETALGASYSQTSSATASTVMLRDANANARINHMTENFSTTVTAAGTTTLTVASSRIQQFTGTTTQTVTLPDCTTLVVGFQFAVLNRSTGIVSVNNNGGSLQQAISGGAQFTFTCTNIGSANGTWDVSSAAGTGTVTSVSGTANQITSTGGATPVLAIASPLLTPGQLQSPVGSSGAPTYSFAGHTNTGMYEVSDTVAIVANGVVALQCTPANGTPIVGTTTNDNATAGNIGEYIEAVVAQASGVSGVNNQYVDMASIALTAGDWDVTFMALIVGNGAVTTDITVGVGNVTGNSAVGLSSTNNIEVTALASGGVTSLTVAGYRVSLSGSATRYAKLFSSFTGGPPKVSGRISARRIR